LGDINMRGQNCISGIHVLWWVLETRKPHSVVYKNRHFPSRRRGIPQSSLNLAIGGEIERGFGA
jgi:hypothetical protein